MAENSEKFLNKVEDVKQNDHAMRNILLVLVALFYVLLLYIGCLALRIISFQMDSFGIINVIFGSILQMKAARSFAAVLTIIFIIVEAVVFSLFKGIKIPEKPDFEYADNGNYGTSKLSTSKEYSKFLELTDYSVETDGIILGMDEDTGKIVSIPRNHPHNRNIFICGSQGTSKSIAFSRTMVIQCAVRGESVFLTDPKGELYRDLALYLKTQGYKVYQWNLVNKWSSDGWALLKEVHGDEPFEYIDIFCKTIIANTGGKDGGDFFDNIELILLEAVCMYVMARYPEEKQTFGSVYDLIRLKSSEELDVMFGELANATDYAGRQAFGAYNLFAKSDKNKGNAVLGLGSRLNIFSGEVVQRMISSPDIQIEDLGKEKTAIFCIASDSNDTYAVLNALLTSMTFIKVMAYADRNGGKCDIPVQFILDEFVNIGALPDFTKKLATARSRDIGMTVIVQNYPQLENRYPNGQAEEIIGGCDFRILLGANDVDTAKYFSTMSGLATIKVTTDRRSVSTSLFSMSPMSEVEGNNEGSGQRTLIQPDEILRMDTDKLLLFVRGEQPIRLKKFKYFMDPNALFLRSYNPADVIPDWAVEDGIYLRTKEPIEETREQMETRILRDPAYFVVKDSEKWGPQRTDLIKILEKVKSRYKGKDEFPDKVPLSAFDEYITGEKSWAEAHGQMTRVIAPEFYREGPDPDNTNSSVVSSGKSAQFGRTQQRIQQTKVVSVNTKINKVPDVFKEEGQTVGNKPVNAIPQTSTGAVKNSTNTSKNTGEPTRPTTNNQGSASGNVLHEKGSIPNQPGAKTGQSTAPTGRKPAESSASTGENNLSPVKPQGTSVNGKTNDGFIDETKIPEKSMKNNRNKRNNSREAAKKPDLGQSSLGGGLDKDNSDSFDDLFDDIM